MTRRAERKQVPKPLLEQLDKCKSVIRLTGLPPPEQVGLLESESVEELLKELSVTDLAAAISVAARQVQVAKAEVNALIASLDPIMKPSEDELLILASFGGLLRDLGFPELASRLLDAAMNEFSLPPHLRAKIQQEFDYSPPGRDKHRATFGLRFM